MRNRPTFWLWHSILLISSPFQTNLDMSSTHLTGAYFASTSASQRWVATPITGSGRWTSLPSSVSILIRRQWPAGGVGSGEPPSPAEMWSLPRAHDPRLCSAPPWCGCISSQLSAVARTNFDTKISWPQIAVLLLVTTPLRSPPPFEGIWNPTFRCHLFPIPNTYPVRRSNPLFVCSIYYTEKELKKGKPQYSVLWSHSRVLSFSIICASPVYVVLARITCLISST